MEKRFSYILEELAELIFFGIISNSYFQYSAPIAQSPLRQDEPVYRQDEPVYRQDEPIYNRQESPVELSRHSSPLENEPIRQSGRNSAVNDELSSSKYVEPAESDGDKYTNDIIATEKKKSGSPIEYSYNKNDTTREPSISSTQSYVSKPAAITEPYSTNQQEGSVSQYEQPVAQSYASKQPAAITEQYSTNQHEGPISQYEQPVEYNTQSGYADNSANQQLYDSNYTTEGQPKYDEQQYEYSQQPYDQTYNAGAYDQQQQQQYDQQQYDQQQYESTSNQQYEQYPTNYDTNYTSQTAYQSEQQQQQPINQSTLSGYTESAPSSATVGQEYTGTGIEPKMQTTRQQPQLLPKQSPKV